MRDLRNCHIKGPPIPPGHHSNLAFETEMTQVQPQIPLSQEDSTIPDFNQELATKRVNQDSENLTTQNNLSSDRNKKRRTAPNNILPFPDLAGQSRTIYLGGVTSEITANDIFNHIKGGAVEALRFLSDKQCAFVDFVDSSSALLFYNKLNTSKRFHVRGIEVKVRWAKSSPISESVSTAIRNGASRNIYFGSLDTMLNESGEEGAIDNLQKKLKASCTKFGMLDQIKIVPERHCAFVHMCSVSDAIKAIRSLTLDLEWKGVKINFGRDRCLDKPPSPTSLGGINTLSSSENIPEEGQISPRMEQINEASIKKHPLRTIYLGGVPSDTTPEEICNIVRGGMLERIQVIPEKRCAFVAFIESKSAESFFEYCSSVGLWIRGTLIKPGWAPPSALSAPVVSALRQGATRNVYLGNIDLNNISETELHKKFSTFGPIEMINFLRRDKNVAFINFCQILDAVKAIDGIRRDPLFINCNVSYGKDRCSQPIKLSDFKVPGHGNQYYQPSPSSFVTPFIPTIYYCPSCPHPPNYVHPIYLSSAPIPPPHPEYNSFYCNHHYQ